MRALKRKTAQFRKSGLSPKVLLCSQKYSKPNAMAKSLKTRAEFDEVVATKGKLVVVDFTASWCPPARGIVPRYDQLPNEFPSGVFVKVDVDDNEETAHAFKVDSMPTFKFFKNGALVDSMVGADYNGLVRMVKKHL